MKKNIGILSMNEQYSFQGCTDVGEDYSYCQNCGKSIRYVVELKDSKGNSHLVGTECAKTLSEANIGNFFSMNEQLKHLKNCAEIYRMLLNEHQIYKFTDGFIIVGRVGKAIKKHRIFRIYDPFLECYISFVDDLIETVHTKPMVEEFCYNDIFEYEKELKLKFT